MTALIEVTGLQKKIDDFHLGPIDLTIEPGTITTLVGNNGSGKSTLLKIMMNLAKPDTGSVKVFGNSVSGQDESWKNRVAYQPQTMVGSDAFTGEALKNLISRFYPNWDEELFKKVIEQLDIPLTKRYGKLSQGSQQKLTFALTIARNARILILDEPTAHMDIPSKKILIDLLVDWIDEEERAIIIASHQVEDIKKLSDYLFVLLNGQSIGNFEKEALTESYKRYWINETLPPTVLPGEVSRELSGLISNDPEVTERFLNSNDIQWSNRTAVELEEIITILLNCEERNLK